MRRIAAHYLIDQGRILHHPLVECDAEGTILSVGEWTRLDNLSNTEFYAGALTAGFVNTHCHLELSYLRGAIERGTGFGGFARAIGMVRNNFTMQQRERALAAASSKMWAEGVQAVADIVNDDSSFAHKRQSPVIYRNFSELFGLLTQPDAMDHLLGESNTSLTPHSTYSLQSESFKRAAQGDMISVHFMESPDEAGLYRGEGSLAAWYRRMGWECDFLHHGSPAKRLVAETDPRTKVLLIHCCCMAEEDMELITSHFTTPPTFVLCPQSNDYISGLRPPLELLLRHNAHVAIGTDSLASNDNLSLIEELKSIPEVPLAQAMRWATLSGAEALGLDAQLGSVEVGKRPGLVIVEGIESRNGELHLTAAARSRRLI